METQKMKTPNIHITVVDGIVHTFADIQKIWLQFATHLDGNVNSETSAQHLNNTSVLIYIHTAALSSPYQPFAWDSGYSYNQMQLR